MATSLRLAPFFRSFNLICSKMDNTMLAKQKICDITRSINSVYEYVVSQHPWRGGKMATYLDGFQEIQLQLNLQDISCCRDH